MICWEQHMEKRRTMRFAWLIVFLLAIFTGGAEGNASGMVGTWEPFVVQKNLGSSVPNAVDTNMITSPHDEFMRMDRNPLVDDAADKKEDHPDSSRFSRVSISFSRVMMEQMKVDIRQQTGSENDKLNTLKALPSTFLNSSYKDTFESLGKIFEPQVNLGIQF